MLYSSNITRWSDYMRAKFQPTRQNPHCPERKTFCPPTLSTTRRTQRSNRICTDSEINHDIFNSGKTNTIKNSSCGLFKHFFPDIEFKARTVTTRWMPSQLRTTHIDKGRHDANKSLMTSFNGPGTPLNHRHLLLPPFFVLHLLLILLRRKRQKGRGHAQMCSLSPPPPPPPFLFLSCLLIRSKAVHIRHGKAFKDKAPYTNGRNLPQLVRRFLQRSLLPQGLNAVARLGERWMPPNQRLKNSLEDIP